MIRFTIAFLLLTVCIHGFAQSSIDNVLREIEKNNKSLQSEKQYWEAEKLSYRTGLNPENPKAEYDYLPGSPAGAGNQTDMSVTQSFDFPTAYGKRRSVSKEQVQQAEYKFQVTRQEILLEAKLICLELVHRNKLSEQLSQRLQSASKLVEATNQKATLGETNVLDLNKIKLLRLEIKNDLERNEMAVVNLKQKLTELNGNVIPEMNVLTYPVLPTLPVFETLDSLIEANDPIVKVYQQDVTIGAEQVALSKSITLPKLEAGYHYQAILGQRYQGFHIGTSIPLWENKNKVKAQQARLSFSEIQVQEHRIEHHSRNRRVYESHLHWRNTVSEYQELLTASNNEALLTKSFEAGQISLIEYLMEVRYLYDAVERFLSAENELNDTVAVLYKFEL
ncbi:MAG TPA: TolC family protein [Cyclobacteriaceae bacterium]|nr:TolC family protein [Cyclobacteriaceae bacterium]HRF32483.1 TolC family protein [Cyclobacteriaceae bacterium]